MKEIYLVTSGSYSDYGVVAVFDSMELAKKYVNSCKKDYYLPTNIEVFELNPDKESLRNGYKAYQVRMTKEGDTVTVTQQEGTPSTHSYFDKHDNTLVSHVFARDSIHAVKIVNEKRLGVLAENKWGE